MGEYSLAFAIANALLCLTRLVICLRDSRIQSVMWLLMTYFSIFFIPLALEKELWHYRGFTGDYLVIKESEIFRTVVYSFLFNLTYLIFELIFSALFRSRSNMTSLATPTDSSLLLKLQVVFGGLLILGAVQYGITTVGHGYQEYVHYKGSSWGMVFLWAGAPFITFSALRKQYFIAALGSLPYLAFMLQMNIRSFALLSVIPLAILTVLQALHSGRAGLVGKLRIFIVLGAFGSVALLMSAVVMVNKSGGQHQVSVFPDAGMPFGASIMMVAADKMGVRTEWDALALYGTNILNPFRKLVAIDPPQIIDPPVVMAQLFDGVPKTSEVYYHYPALWYSDAYLAFGNFGIFLAILWAFITVGWEKIMNRNAFLLCISLPFYSWHAYMLVRGAIAGASVPFLYAAWIAMIVAFMIGGWRILQGELQHHESPARNQYTFNWGS